MTVSTQLVSLAHTARGHAARVLPQHGCLRAALLTLATVGLGAAPVAAQECMDPPSGMTAWWAGEGSAEDIHAGNHATAVNGVTFGAGFVGQAFTFDGTGGGRDDRVDLPRQVLHGLSDFTIEMWVHTTDGDAGALVSGAASRSGGDNELILQQHRDPTDLSMVVKGNSSGRLPLVLNDGAWHHVAFVRADTTGELWIDGVLQATHTVPNGTLELDSRGLVLGQEQDCAGGCFDPNQAFDGMMDEVSVYGRALSGDEIAAIVDAGEAGKCKPLTFGELFPLIAELELEVESNSERVTELEAVIDEMDARMLGLEELLMELSDRVDSMEAGGSGGTPEEDCGPWGHSNLKRHILKRKLEKLKKHGWR